MRLQNVERSEVTADLLHVYLNGQKDIDKKGGHPIFGWPLEGEKV